LIVDVGPIARWCSDALAKEGVAATPAERQESARRAVANLYARAH
jgi:hypothetical protein